MAWPASEPEIRGLFHYSHNERYVNDAYSEDEIDGMTDSTNSYKKGDKVLYQGKTYESLIDTNVWSPSAYPAGWKEV